MAFMKGLLGGAGAPSSAISPAEAKAMLDRGEAIVVDVREPREVALSGKIPGALVIPYQQIALHAGDNASAEPRLDRGKAIIAYCASGARSGVAVQTLKQLGFETVYNLGSLKAWAEAGLPVER